MKDPEDGDNVEKYSDNNEELSDGKERWSCPACCKQGRVTRSGSTSSTCGARSETTAPLQPDQSTPTDTLTLILNQFSTMASDIKDIKNSQSQLRTDVAYCRNLLQQHSDSISRHDDLIAASETNIQNIQVFGSSSKAMSEQKKRKVETSNDPNVWLKWYHELSDESDLSESSKDEDESDKEEENILTESEHNTESEQEVAESEEVESDEDVPLDSSSFYIGKDKITKWRKANPPRNVKTRSHVKNLQGTEMQGVLMR
ncbi:unnamed protein product [Acanthoscelides obtectus]|uniref:Uncharacterized protein n=1 Tax=Acanthoscelides obtectus TaxID=200917 RepID=A0A9P0KL64_ACAOB|nr:unnamed protein product [Acanthoscelides obtectus]CAK1670271.1 hypothetical protein AOBTE_LOCUS27523 [Acanthoscelides obtectus]